MLEDINRSLPEGAPVPIYNQQYISDGEETDLKLVNEAEVWVTFVHEGAGWKNTLGFYTYELDNPPNSKHDIDSITVIFPNVSYTNGGGGLTSGDKVKLGSFKANTGIGWVLIAQGWNNGVGNGLYKHYSNPDFNIETTASKRRHNVILNDKNRNLFLLGFEDVSRETWWCDNDFNDAIFYITATPNDAIISASYIDIQSDIIDSDGDGVADYNDDYPSDNTKAYNNFFPGKNSHASLAFEDLWPFKGDYDFNDLVMDYNINQIANSNNQIVEITGYYVVRAIGAGFHNGFGFEINMDPSQVLSVSGSILNHNYISIASNGVEAGQSKAVVVLFDDAYNILSTSGGNYVNTEPDKPFVEPDTVSFTIKLKNPLNPVNLNLPPYNPFLIKNKNRGYEIHLPGFEPTDLANMELLGIEQDDSNPTTKKYFKTANNLPWGILLPYSFDYPIEGTQILNAHLKFSTWAESGGAFHSNWYLDENGFRDKSKVYKK